VASIQKLVSNATSKLGKLVLQRGVEEFGRHAFATIIATIFTAKSKHNA